MNLCLWSIIYKFFDYIPLNLYRCQRMFGICPSWHHASPYIQATNSHTPVSHGAGAESPPKPNDLRQHTRVDRINGGPRVYCSHH